MPRIARWLLGLFGWQVIFESPPGPKAVMMFYPHTSNWDFVVAILARMTFGIPVTYAAKDSLFVPPLGWLFRALGGTPVNRRERTGFVGQMVAQFETRESFYLAIAPEGTRKATDALKSGFYRVALEARVPLGLGFIDYPNRRVGVMGYMQLTGDEAQDLARLAEAYRNCRGKHVHQQGPFSFGSRRV